MSHESNNIVSIPNSRVTDTHVYFLNGPFSQWFKSRFIQTLDDNSELMEFNCAEQFMMASKAHLFNDQETLVKILKTSSPREQKELGRAVQNFDVDTWNSVAKNIVYRGNLAKFSQNEKLKHFLLSTESRTIVEGAWYDPVWGVGIAWNDDQILDENNWKGTNWLGEVLMQVRATLSS